MKTEALEFEQRKGQFNLQHKRIHVLDRDPVFARSFWWEEFK